MSSTDSSILLCGIRPLDLSEIGAVGFDLDHTLALYDDEAVNRLASQETAPLLTAAGYGDAALAGDSLTAAARGLSMDLRHGNVLKIGADGRVMLARRGEDWLSREAIAAQYDGHDPADESTTWHVHSPFDIPTLWFFSTLGPFIREPRDTASAGRLLADIRRSLDASHTRGELKRHIANDLDRFVAPAGDVLAGLQRWKDDGKKLFVVTNSDPKFAELVLDHVLGSSWPDVFDVVITDAAKPRFFDHSPTAPKSTRVDRGKALVLDGAHASHIEAQLRLPPARILYAGDNARADIIPARRRGWKTVHVVAELSAAEVSTPWAGALHHLGAPTWFAKTIYDHADAACARIDGLLDVDARSRIAGIEHLYARITGAKRQDDRGDAS